MKSVVLVMLLLVMGPLLVTIPFAQASSDGDGEGAEEGSEEESNESEGTDEEEGGATTPVTPPEEGEESAKEKAERENNNGNNEPLPYCDNDSSGSCHDIDDIDEVTGKYPCNDGTQRTNKENCPDATKPVLPTQPGVPLSRSTTILTTFSVQGSSGPVEQTGPIPIPKPGEAVLKIFYEDEWTGNILDSNNTSVSYDGDGNYSIVFPCAEDDFGFFSLTVQKGDDDDEIMQLVVQNHLNQTLKQGQTSAEFGVVSLSGECEL